MNKIRDNKNRYRDYAVKLGVFASFLLVTVLSIYFYSPVIKSHAMGEADNIAKVELDVDDYLYLTTDKDELNLVGHTNTFVSGQVGIQVSTNALLGYSLSIEDTDNNTN